MAYTTIDKPTDYFNTVTYTGNGSTQSITGVGFQPDWIWLKDRDNAYSHQLVDVVRGNTKYLNSNETASEGTASDRVTSFDSDGFSLGSYIGTNKSSSNVVSWNWKAGGTASSNTDGSITSTVSANTTAGFSIGTYTGTGSNATIGHGLGATPKLVICKRRDIAEYWVVQHADLGSGQILYLQETGAASSTGTWNNTDPTSTTFGVGTTNNINASGGTYVFYCFAEKKGYSKFGSYTGNGSTDGTFVYTGFKPAWVLIKNSSTGNISWTLYDNKRPGYNEDNAYLLPSSSDSELSDKDIDLLSNGFKPRTSNSALGTSGDTYIYMCFAEAPFVTSTGIPTTAR